MLAVYMSPAVASVQALYAGLHEPDNQTVQQLLHAHAKTLELGQRQRDPGAAFVIANWWPPMAMLTREELFNAPFNAGDARVVVAREHGFADWGEVASLGIASPDIEFERAVDAVVNGDIEQLKPMLEANPGLVSMRSIYGHGATLLAYLTANGVETRRQTTPLNAAAVARVLLAAGADANATAHVYEGDYTVFELAQTSPHLANAGVLDDLMDALGEG